MPLSKGIGKIGPLYTVVGKVMWSSQDENQYGFSQKYIESI